MRDYGKVHTTFWSSKTIGSLDDDGRLLALYLMTSPHTTITGAFRLPDGYVCEDMRWSAERVSKGFMQLLANGFANRCETTKWVWICKHLEWNPPENPNQRKSARKLADAIPDDCTWKIDFLDVCGEAVGYTNEEMAALSETLPKRFRNQDQDQKQEQEQDKDSRRGEDPETIDRAMYAEARRIFGDKSGGGMMTKAIKVKGRSGALTLVDACRNMDPEQARSYFAAALKDADKPKNGTLGLALP